jgi:hypothetical protein
VSETKSGLTKPLTPNCSSAINQAPPSRSLSKTLYQHGEEEDHSDYGSSIPATAVSVYPPDELDGDFIQYINLNVIGQSSYMPVVQIKGFK